MGRGCLGIGWGLLGVVPVLWSGCRAAVTTRGLLLAGNAWNAEHGGCCRHSGTVVVS
jgi:hypothetical protein